jgi:hypothetical protein
MQGCIAAYEAFQALGLKPTVVTDDTEELGALPSVVVKLAAADKTTRATAIALVPDLSGKVKTSGHFINGKWDWRTSRTCGWSGEGGWPPGAGWGGGSGGCPARVITSSAAERFS